VLMAGLARGKAWSDVACFIVYCGLSV
jgi:hypothetical protein